MNERLSPEEAVEQSYRPPRKVTGNIANLDENEEERRLAIFREHGWNDKAASEQAGISESAWASWRYNRGLLQHPKTARPVPVKPGPPTMFREQRHAKYGEYELRCRCGSFKTHHIDFAVAKKDAISHADESHSGRATFDGDLSIRFNVGGGAAPGGTMPRTEEDVTHPRRLPDATARMKPLPGSGVTECQFRWQALSNSTHIRNGYPPPGWHMCGKSTGHAGAHRCACAATQGAEGHGSGRPMDVTETACQATWTARSDSWHVRQGFKPPHVCAIPMGHEGNHECACGNAPRPDYAYQKATPVVPSNVSQEGCEVVWPAPSTSIHVRSGEASEHRCVKLASHDGVHKCRCSSQRVTVSPE